jgi:hypothetical protein
VTRVQCSNAQPTKVFSFYTTQHSFSIFSITDPLSRYQYQHQEKVTARHRARQHRELYLLRAPPAKLRSVLLVSPLSVFHRIFRLPTASRSQEILSSSIHSPSCIRSASRPRRRQQSFQSIESLVASPCINSFIIVSKKLGCF